MTNGVERPILFLDVDGVLLRRRSGQMRSRDAFEVAPHSLQILGWVIKNFDVRWLSSRYQSGDAQEVCHAFPYALSARELPPDWQLLDTIPAARWETRKVDAIDLSADFYWVDDNHGEAALAFLASHGRADRAIETNVDRDPEALLETMHRLAEAIGAAHGEAWPAVVVSSYRCCTICGGANPEGEAMSTIAEWLASLGMSEYAGRFAETVLISPSCET